MKCPECGGKVRTLDVVHNDDDNETYRLKKCPVCGHSFHTVEFGFLGTEGKFKYNWNKYHRKSNKTE